MTDQENVDSPWAPVATIPSNAPIANAMHQGRHEQKAGPGPATTEEFTTLSIESEKLGMTLSELNRKIDRLERITERWKNRKSILDERG